VTELVFFERQCFERAALKFARRAEPLCEIVGDTDSDIHTVSLIQRDPRSIDVQTGC
jgi:hypothetical protein